MPLSVLPVCFAVMWCATATPVRAEVIDRILAVVSGQVITLADVRGAIDLGLEQVPRDADPIGYVLDKLIDRELMLLEVERYAPPEPNASVVQEMLVRVRGRFSDDMTFSAALRNNGMTEERLRQFLRNNARIETYLDQRFASAAQPTEEEVDRYFQQHEAELRPDGPPMPAAAVRELARSRLAAAERLLLINEWVDGLRRRTELVVLHLPGK